MAALVQAAARALLGHGAPLPRAARSISCGVARVPHVKEPPQPKQVDRWTEKRALFGVYDNVGILGKDPLPPPQPQGDFKAHPKDLIVGPKWLRGWRGNELQRCIRKKQVVGDRMFVDDYHKLNKRIRYLYRRFNRTGKHR
ncbi:large ribosomal subunit protein mL51 [Dromaius novaehollandiae]|uniref:large ribosomal subunit protein mL51 n=1 Tax=Dromaius novaehollandiae TaxID=8790 RepID=UPI00311FFDC0